MSFGRFLPGPIRRALRWVYFALWVPFRNRYVRRFTTRFADKDTVLGFWRSPDDLNAPETYLWQEDRSRLVVETVQRWVPEGSVLELGCNSGRNLEFLRQAGYFDLHAVEINPAAIDLLRETYPDLASTCTVHVGAMEDEVPRLHSYDCVFSVTVLQHVHPDSEGVFKDIARITNGFLITIEDEKGPYWRQFPRNYREVFEPLGLTQVDEFRKRADMPADFVGRVFRKD